MTRADTSAHLPCPAVSIIIPAHNAAATIRETLESVIAQSLSDFEVIVIDDGSTDDTAEAVRSVADERVAVHSFPQAGAAAARNHGIEVARGEFIAFLDADDLWTPDKLELQIAALREHPDAGVVYSWVTFIDESGRDLHQRKPVRHQGDVRRHLLVDCFLATASNPVLRRACVMSTGGFDATLARAEDWDYWLRASRHWPFVVVPRYQTRYRVSRLAQSSSVDLYVAAVRTVLDRAFLDAPSLMPLKRRALANFDRYAAFVYVTRAPEAGWRRSAVHQLGRAVRRYPRILLERETYDVMVAWLVSLAPGSLGPRGVRALLRFHGRLASDRPVRRPM